jgi:hypothetical protein
MAIEDSLSEKPQRLPRCPVSVMTHVIVYDLQSFCYSDKFSRGFVQKPRPGFRLGSQ